jgi:PAB1-binding protein PBP1
LTTKKAPVVETQVVTGERKLEKASQWTKSADSNPKQRLEDLPNQNFDQFKNRGPNNYDDTKYNSKIDESKIDHAKVEEAARIEKEILNDKSTTNVHRLEDRGQTREKDNSEDEEEKYSGVARALGKSGKFTCFC